MSTTAPFSLRELAFYRTERQRLDDMGMTNYNEQSAELSRRWNAINQITSRPAMASPGVPPVAMAQALPGMGAAQQHSGTFRLPFRLTDLQMRNSGVHIAGFDNGMYVYNNNPLSAAALAAAAPAAMPAGETVEVKVPFPLSAEQMTRSILYLAKKEGSIYVYKKMSPALAAARPVDVIDLLSDDDTIVGKKRPRANLAVTSRILNKCRKDTLQDICDDLDVPISGNKIDLVERIMTDTGISQVLLSKCRKETLQNICEDHETPISGNKPELIARIIRA